MLRIAIGHSADIDQDRAVGEAIEQAKRQLGGAEAKAGILFSASALDHPAVLAEVGRSPWQMRTGVHSGGLTAGVIGRHKFAYDTWGDTVNVASRVQSVCPANEVLVSEATAMQLSSNVELADEREVELKGRGRARVFRVVEMRQANV